MATVLPHNVIPIVVIPFIGFAACGVLLAVGSARLLVYSRLNDIMEQIKGYDRVLIAKLVSLQSEAEMTAIVRKLIETGNLPEYRIVADCMLVREGVSVGESEARAEYDRFKGVVVQPNETTAFCERYCPSCGNACHAEDRFCSKCGRLL